MQENNEAGRLYALWIISAWHTSFYLKKKESDCSCYSGVFRAHKIHTYRDQITVEDSLYALPGMKILKKGWGKKETFPEFL